MRTNRLSAIALMIALAGALLPGCGGAQQEVAAGPAAAVAGPSPAQGSDGTVARIVDAILSRRGAYERLVTLCDSFGHRLSGSPELEAAIGWALSEPSVDRIVVEVDLPM